jgi:hypothetical protein
VRYAFEEISASGRAFDRYSTLSSEFAMLLNARLHRRGLAALLIPALLSLAQPALSAEVNGPSRFSGAATIAKAALASSNARFQLEAALSISAQASGDARYYLSAKLSPDPRSVAGSCAPSGENIFSNGFE